MSLNQRDTQFVTLRVPRKNIMGRIGGNSIKIVVMI